MHFKRLNIPKPSGGERVWVVNADFAPVPVTFPDSAIYDPFNRIRTSEPYTVFDSKLIHNKEPLLYDEDIANNSGTATATHSTIEARVRMEVGNSDNITRQSFERYNYQPGKGALVLLTYNMVGADTDVNKMVGVFDDNNGMFLRHNGTDLQVVIRKNAVDHAVNQGNWNLDPFNGQGISGITLDVTKVQILVIDYEWLGVGRVRFGFVIDGLIYYVHEFNHANNIETVYTSTPNLPVRYEIDAGAAGSGALDHICSTIISEGGVEPTGKEFSVTSGPLVTIATANTIYGILAIRLRATYLDLLTKIESITTLSDSQGDYYVHLYLNPTLAGGSWSWNNVDATNSGMQFADGGNGVTINGGVRMFSAIISGGDTDQISLSNERNLGSQIDGTPDIIALAIQPLTNNQDVAATINWREV